ncbi:ATP-binding protein [Limosilactobacillus caecicola]|uniref:ATP-binding protein n=1 Tax=Limosilactobacillus caecicola TaxID=2941332 RepID=UPI00203C8086|nr:ATP-binding protein [Limosilactobacillus caecicola]
MENKRHIWEEKLNRWYTDAFYPTPFSLIDIRPNDEVFTIKVKPGRHKPYAIESEGFSPKGVYIRYGSSAVRATNEQIKRMLQQNSESNEFDAEMSAEQNLTFDTLKKRAVTKNLDFSAKALHMLKSSDIYNNAALLVSDQNTTVTKVAIYQGTNVMEFKDKREITGGLTGQIDELLYYIGLNNHTNIKIDGNPQRHEVKDYPDAAIREAVVVNAFAHRDYLLHSTIKVEIFDDRMEILSPGGIPDGLTLDEIKDGMTAVRNPQLVHILDKLKYIENYGTGIRRMVDAYQESDQEPQFEVRPNSFKVTLPNVNYAGHIESSATQHTNKDLSTKAQLLLILDQEGPQSRQKLQNELDLSMYYIKKYLKELSDEGKLTKIGSSVNTKYKKL